MKIQMMENLDAPPSYRYAYDAEGFYVGLIKAQPHPLRSGEFLTPANTCCIRPTFVEGYRPRWDGSAWHLESNALKKIIHSSVPENVLHAKRDEMFEHLRENLLVILTSELRSRIDERIEEAFPMFTKLVSDSSRSFLSLVKDEKISTDTRFKNLEDIFFNKFQKRLNELALLESKIEQRLSELMIMEEMIKAENVVERSFFEKVKSYFRKSEPALIESQESKDVEKI